MGRASCHKFTCGNAGCLQCYPVLKSLTRRRRWMVEANLITLKEAVAESMEFKGLTPDQVLEVVGRIRVAPKRALDKRTLELIG